MKTKFILLAFTVTIAASWYAIAGTDYTRIKKDVSVMSGIIKGAFEADQNCKMCKVRVEGKYLAGQGILFLINSSSSSRSWLHQDDTDFSFSFTFDDDDHDILFIPERVNDIMSSVLPEILDLSALSGLSELSDVNWAPVVKIVGDSTRIELRKIRRERRELEQEIRENEIEIIHLDEDKINDIEANIKGMQESVRKLGEKQHAIKKKAKASRDEYTKKREVLRMKRQAHSKQQQALIQNTVLQAFCDYGSTLRSLPAKEKVTIIFENTHRDTRQDTVLVFDQAEITDCKRDSNSLRNQAISYLF